MASVVPYESGALSLPVPPPPVPRPRTLLVGAALAGTAGAMTIFTMVSIYLARRSDVLNRGETWLPRGSQIPLPQPNMMFLTLLMSCVTLAWAASALRREDKQNAYIALAITTLMAFAYVVQASYLFTLSEIPVNAPRGQGVLFWAISGGHLAMVLAGLVFFALMSFRALSGNFRRIPDGITAVGIYWYITVGVYAVIWYAVYITK